MTEDLYDSEYAKGSLRSKAVEAVFAYFTTSVDRLPD